MKQAPIDRRHGRDCNQFKSVQNVNDGNGQLIDSKGCLVHQATSCLKIGAVAYIADLNKD